MPFFIPILIFAGLTGAGLIGQAVIPTKVSEEEKRIIIEQTKKEIQVVTPVQTVVQDEELNFYEKNIKPNQTILAIGMFVILAGALFVRAVI